jgi:hypothetical protein
MSWQQKTERELGGEGRPGSEALSFLLSQLRAALSSQPKSTEIVGTDHSSRFSYAGLSLAKTLSWGKTKDQNCPRIHLQITSRKQHERSEKTL